jgi:autotransporter-associated beta strand protein
LYTQVVQAAPTFIGNGGRNLIYLKNDADITYGGGLTSTQLAAEGGTSPDFVGGQIQFLDSASAGESFSAAILALPGENGGGAGEVWFLDDSSLGVADVVSRISENEGSTSGVTYFMGTSSGANGYVTCLSTQAANVEGGKAFFFDSSTAGNAQVYAGGGAYGDHAGGGHVTFSDNSSAGNADLFATGGFQGGLGGTYEFLADSSGGSAQVELDVDASLLISDHNPPGITIGSLSDTDVAVGGIVILGSNTLTVGSNTLSTTFSGVIDGSGSLTKIGTGTLTLTGISSYSGGTSIEGGGLIVSNAAGSATGSGPLQVLGATLSGDGIIGGPVSIGTGGLLAPSAGGGNRERHRLTLQNSLTFLAGGTYSSRFKIGQHVYSDQVFARGGTIESGATFAVTAQGNRALPAGTSFLIINNTSNSPISGRFDNLPDNGAITINSNKFQANYEGNNGNDLVLTVVP